MLDQIKSHQSEMITKAIDVIHDEVALLQDETSMPQTDVKPIFDKVISSVSRPNATISVRNITTANTYASAYKGDIGNESDLFSTVYTDASGVGIGDANMIARGKYLRTSYDPIDGWFDIVPHENTPAYNQGSSGGAHAVSYLMARLNGFIT